MKGEFRKAIEMILDFYCDDNDIMKKIDEGKADEISFGDKDDTETAKEIIDYLSRKRNDYVGAMKIIPKKILQIYVKSLQSEIFNRTVSGLIRRECVTREIEIIKEKLSIPDDVSDYNKFDISVPIVGFSTKFSDDRFSGIIQKILEEFGLSQRSFIVRQLPDLSEEGTERKMITTAKNVIVSEILDDELNSGKKKVKLSFELDPGSYATIFVKHILAYNSQA